MIQQYQHQYNLREKYGHKFGSGSISLDNDDSSTLTKATYAQYKNLLLDQGDTKFNSSSSGTFESDDIYIINLSLTSDIKKKWMQETGQ